MRVLLTVSGTISTDLAAAIAAGRRPRADYVELAHRFAADLLDRASAMDRLGRVGVLVGRLVGGNAVLALACFRVRRCYDVIVTDGEQVGLPLACLLRLRGGRRPRHLMVVHVLSVPMKERLYTLFRLGPLIDLMFVYASRQRVLITERLRYPAEQLVLTPFMVDTTFFAPDAVVARPERMICAAGLERRDYRTLMDAVRGLDVRVVIAAGSPWSTRPDSARSEVLPENVEVCTLDFVALRQLYADACFVVMPLHEGDFQAGVTTILEAMAMGKAVVCSRTRGQTDVLVEGETGLYVAPHDPTALRCAIERLLDEPPLARQLGAAARRWAVANADVGVYADRLGAHVDRARANGD